MNIDQDIERISRGSAEIISVASLKEKLSLSAKKKIALKVKAGFDPTAPDIHLGHVVLLRKLRQFQDMGHHIDFLVGDFTALVGDPTGRNKLRPNLDSSFIKDNAKTYTEQAFKILDKEKTNVVFNGNWLNDLSSARLLALTAQSTVAQMLARNDFKLRFDEGTEISVMEFIYPLLQGFDSYVLKSDIELGGTDQKFNLLMGRQIQEALKEDEAFKVEVRSILKDKQWEPAQSPQVVIMTPLLEGTDGVQKMSKSLNNYIGINESPKDIFGKIMSLNDVMMMKYYEYLTGIDLKEVSRIHPKDAKLNLGEHIVSYLHNANEGKQAREEFEHTFSQKGTPQNIEEVSIKDVEGGKQFVEMLIASGIVESKREYARLIKQGSVSLDGIKINVLDWHPEKGVLKIGKRRFLKII